MTAESTAPSEAGNGGLVFYYAPMSTAVFTEMVIAELDVPHERIELSIAAGETRTADYLAVNPNGYVPAIVHGGSTIWEAAAITMYLGETFGVDAGLYPAAGPRRGEAMKWTVWCSVALASAAGRLSATLDSGADGAVEAPLMEALDDDVRSARAGARARAEVDRNLRILDAALGAQPFLLGDYSVVDTHVFGLIGWLMLMGVELSPYVHVGAWCGRCAARPALAPFA